jgi:predicted ABC-type transport system involved in lysophospholipase L1 biosynthesis ATPase subunit
MEPVLSLRDVWLSYSRGRRHMVHVLADVSLQVFSGEVLAVRAQRAQGKTSLLRVAAGIERPDRGEVLFAGQELWGISSEHRARLLRKRIALVKREGPLPDVPVLTCAALPLLEVYGRETHARVEQALARVGASGCAQRRWSELTDWERVLVVLAHGIVCEPQLLLVDNPATTLGIGEREEIAGLIAELARERDMAVVICADDAGMTSGADRIATLAGGTLLVAPPEHESEPGDVLYFPVERTRRAC